MTASNILSRSAAAAFFIVLCFVTLHFASAFAFSPVKSALHENWRPTTKLGATTERGKIGASFSKKLVESLDLVPLFEGVSLHAATRRGRQAILGLVNIVVPAPSKTLGTESISRRQALLASIDSYPVISPLESPSHLQKPIPILRIAQTAGESSAEYQLVREATAILRENNTPSLPPLYSGTSPWDTNVVNTDDDEWISLALAGYAESMDLENVLQADKVCSRLVQMWEWATIEATVTRAPEISKIVQEICIDQMRAVLSEVEGTVQIVRKRTISDPSGTKSFSFQLDGDKFPSLRLLRQKEQAIMAELDHTMQKLDENVELGDDLIKVREEIAIDEEQILRRLVSVITQAAPLLDNCIDVMARVDVIFARAAFGHTLNGEIPEVFNNGVIDIKDFIHPVLALRNLASKSSAVPIDLKLSGDQDSRALIISGPNGGGKTLALKSFGIASILSKVGIPIPVNKPVSRNDGKDVIFPRVDFFREIHIEVGDQQNVDGGESTLMARLNSCSKIIHRLSSAKNGSDTQIHPLILLDELGGGTDPEAGSALARAILEEILETSTARIVATTHSPQLKAMSIENDLFGCASVLLESRPGIENEFKRPTFHLQYGIIGDSYALGAASRCFPSLPISVLDRAADLMAGDRDKSEIFRAMMTSLGREKDAAEAATQKAETIAEEAMKCRSAIVALAQAHEDHLSRLETRLNSIFTDLKKDQSGTVYDLVGNTLGEVRLVKEKILSEKELLASRGLKAVPFDYQFTEGENVVIVAEGEYNGQTATIASRDVGGKTGELKEVLVFPSLDWEWRPDEVDAQPSPPKVFKVSDIALWDYPTDWPIDGETKSRSISEAKQGLFDTLNKLSSSNDGKSRQLDNPSTSSRSKFTSSRERKAATVKAKKNSQRAKKASRKKRR